MCVGWGGGGSHFEMNEKETKLVQIKLIFLLASDLLAIRQVVRKAIAKHLTVINEKAR